MNTHTHERRRSTMTRVDYPAASIQANVAAAEQFRHLGVIERGEDHPEGPGCSFCLYHAYDAAGNQLDGGSLQSLLHLHREGAIKVAFYRRVVDRRI